MVRLIKRYESRKLYDTEESRYVSLDEIAAFVRRGQEVRVIDNASSEDVTSQTLTQIILEEGRNGRTRLPTELLHHLVRVGERALSSGVETVREGVDIVLEKSMDRLAPVRRAREEMDRLRARLEDLEASLDQFEAKGRGNGRAAAQKRPASKRTHAKKKTAKAAAKPRPRAGRSG